MPKFYKTLLAAVLLTTTLDVTASGITAIGNISCGSWTKNKSSTSPHEAWLFGYLSGIAWGKRNDFLKETDAESIILWVDNYCKINPLKKVGDAAGILVEELTKK